MSKAKTASKNNPTTREQAKEFFHKDSQNTLRKIKSVKLITSTGTFFAAEYETGDIVLDSSGHPLTWQQAKNV